MLFGCFDCQLLHSALSLVFADHALVSRVSSTSLVPFASNTPELLDPNGASINSGNVGQQATIEVTIQNQLEDRQSYVALLEVRDGSGTTVNLAWQSGALGSGADGPNSN